MQDTHAFLAVIAATVVALVAYELIASALKPAGS